MPKNKCQKFKNGFTLVETLIAVFIFSMALLMLTSTFSGFLKNYSASKKIQRNIENVQYAMNLMAKTLRTSDVNSISGGTLGSTPSVDTLDTYDHSQDLCIRYQVVNGTEEKVIQMVDSGQDPGDIAKLTDCDWTTGSAETLDLTNDIIKDVIVEADSSVSPNFGKVTINLAVEGYTSDIITQFSVSLRQ